MGVRLSVAVLALCMIGALPALAQRPAPFAPAEPVPADHAGADWRDSRGCLFVRGSADGAVLWLPVLDAERRPVCDAVPVADTTPAGPTDPATAAPAPIAAVAAPETEREVPPQVPRAAEALARAAGALGALGGALPGPVRAGATLAQGGTAAATERPAEVPPPMVEVIPSRPLPIPAGPDMARPSPEDPLAALARLADTASAPTGRLVMVEPDDRLRIIHVEGRSVLVGGGDPFGVNAPLAGARAAAHPGGGRGAAAGYHPPPGRLTVAPPIIGFGPDPAPASRRTPIAPEAELAVWDGSSPAPFGPSLTVLPGTGPGDDRLTTATRARREGGALWVLARR
jgi:hypothetical protein